MDPRRVRAVAGRIASQFRRDHRSLGLLVGAPILILSLVWALWGRDATLTSRVAVATDRPVPSAIVEALRDDDALEVTEATLADAMTALEAGELDAVLSTRVGTVSTELIVALEGSDPFQNGAAIQSIQRALIAGVTGALAQTPLPVKPPEVRVEFLHGGEAYTLLDHLAPLLVGLFAFFFTFLLSAVAFLRERTTGTLERLMATPLRRGELVVGYLAGFSFFALVQAVVIIAFTLFVLNIRYTGNVGTIFLITAMLVIVSVSTGLFISAFARTELQAIQFIPIVLVPQIFLSGLLVPVDQLPEVLRPIAAVLPLTYANEALRAVMIKGVPLSDPLILRDLGAIGAFAVVTVAGAILSIRREVA